MKQEPSPEPHLRAVSPQHFDIDLKASMKTLLMEHPQTVTITNSRYLYWSLAQQLAHLTSNGVGCIPGELCASGTISGMAENSFGSLLELTWRGTKPIEMHSGEQRTFLEDGDTVLIEGEASNDKFKIGLGEVVGQIFPSGTHRS